MWICLLHAHVSSNKLILSQFIAIILKMFCFEQICYLKLLDSSSFYENYQSVFQIIKIFTLSVKIQDKFQMVMAFLENSLRRSYFHILINIFIIHKETIRIRNEAPKLMCTKDLSDCFHLESRLESYACDKEINNTFSAIMW